MQELEAISAGLDLSMATAAAASRKTRDFSKIPVEEQRKIIQKESPELVGLLKECKERMTELQTRIEPLIQRVRRGELPTSKGVSYLELKFHLLLCYLINLTYYISLKVSVLTYCIFLKISYLRFCLALSCAKMGGGLVWIAHFV